MMIVEDVALLGLELADAFARHGVKVVGPLATPAHAILHIERGNVGLAVLDVMLGEEDVYAVAECLVQRRIPFAVTTARRRSTLRPPLSNVPYFAKPYDPKAVAIAVLALLDASDRHGDVDFRQPMP
ncbi:MAG: hypothetical protein U1E46_07045 [Hyphomicrobiales bacterium]